MKWYGMTESNDNKNNNNSIYKDEVKTFDHFA